MDHKAAALSKAVATTEEITVLLQQQPNIDAENVAKSLERLYGLLNQISEGGRSMDESSSRNIPMDVLTVLESEEFRGLEAFEQKLLATASDHAKALRAKSKHLQQVKISVEDMVNKNKEI